MKRITTLALCLFACCCLQAQESAKKGLNVGVLPAISFNTDEGFQYGAVVNLFNYGDGTNYPKYDHSYYLELSKYTKGSTVLRFYFDSDKLIRNVRSFVDVSYITEGMLDFFGFNGFKSTYSESLESANRAFYKMSQKQFRLLADFKGELPIDHLFWEASYNLVNYSNGAVDYVQLNKNTDFPALVPGESLYEKYVGWGLIGAQEANGGLVSALKVGLLYDTRQVLNNPGKGTSTEALIEIAPKFMNESPYARYSILHKQYQSIVKDYLNLAFRLGVQGQLGKNNVPFYRRPVLMSPFATRTSPTGLGGTNSLRGIMRNRIVGESFALGNVELRWKVLNFRLMNQNYYLGLNGFFDAGYLLKPIDWDVTEQLTPTEQADYFDLEVEDNLHASLGGGFKVAMNQNFIVSVEMGKPLNANDGSKMGTYINLNYLF